MSLERWVSVDTVVEGGRVHVLQQRYSYTMSDSGLEPHRSNEHRLIPMNELEGVAPNDADVEEVDRVD